MVYIRIKKFKRKSGQVLEYAYLVENKWYKRGFKNKKKGPRQKVSKYLGRVYNFEKVNDIGFFDFKVMENAEQYIINNSYDDIIKDLVRWEMYRHDIGDEFSVSFDSKKVINNNKDVTLKINEGFLNSYTLRRLFNLKKDDSYYLAKSFVEAGIEIPKEVFVGLFSED